MAGAAVAIHGLRRTRLSDTAQELIGGLLAIAPAIFSLRGGSLAAYHGAEHIAIGTYEHGRAARPRSTSAAAATSSAR